MVERLKQAISIYLQDPDAISSIAPLLIVLVILTSLTGGFIFVILRALRTPHEGSEASVEDTEEKSSPLSFFNKAGNFFQRILPKSSQEISGHPHSETFAYAELAELRLEVQRLERENRSLRAQSTQGPTGKLEEAENEIESLRADNELAHQKVHDLEGQLKDIMLEIDKMYAENVRALEQAKGPSLETERYRRLYEEQSQEIEKMKSVLRLAKVQIVSLTQKSAR